MKLRFRFSRHGGGVSGAGTANRNTQIQRGRLAVGLVLASAAALLTMACGGSSSSNLQQTPITNGAVYTFIGDTPSCDLLSLGIFITELKLHKVGKPSTSLVTVWPTGTSLTSPVLEMGNLRDIMTVANLTSIPPGSYDQASLKVIVNTASTYDPTQSPPVRGFNPTLSTDTVTFNLQPALTVASGKVSAIHIDLNVGQSLTVDSHGQLTGNINWVFSGYPMVASSSNGFGEMDGMYGFVRSVNPSSPGAGFTSSFLLQTHPATSLGRGPALNVDLNDNTDLCMNGSCGVPVSDINQLTTGNYVEVDAYVDQNGNLVAKRIQVEDREFLSQQLLAYMGPVLDVTKDPNGNVTQFDMLVRETEPPDVTNVPNSTPVTVYVSQSTTFNPLLISPDLDGLASSGNLAFAANTIVPGMEVVVHGVYSKSSGGTTTVTANSVYPRFQAVQGMFTSLTAPPGSDNKTGAFQMAPCSSLLNNNPFMVVTDAQTIFENTSGLSTLSPTSPMLARGEAFFDLKGSTINGVQVPAGTMVLLANKVRQY
jgi:Domain of unknown function (DUF5666)